jgi:hypothetical protein
MGKMDSWRVLTVAMPQALREADAVGHPILRRNVHLILRL